MKRFLIFVILVGAVASFEPRIRERLIGLFPALSAATHQRSAERTVTQIALAVHESAAQSGVYPQPSGFGEWVLRAHRPRQDPWGADYYLELYPDSFVVGSPGPDARRRTGDDIRLARFRGPNAQRLRPGYSPPPPPASGVKASAIRNATQAATRDKR
jgi:hypothetical protein